MTGISPFGTKTVVDFLIIMKTSRLLQYYVCPGTKTNLNKISIRR